MSDGPGNPNDRANDDELAAQREAAEDPDKAEEAGNEEERQPPEDIEALRAAIEAELAQKQRTLNLYTIVMLAIGGALLVFAVTFPMPLPGFSILTFTVGLAIILTAAGTIAGFQQKGIVVGGAGALAIILTFVMHQLGLLSPSTIYSKALVKDVPDRSVVEVAGSGQIYGRKSKNTVHEFLATPDMIVFDTLDAVITTRPDGCSSDDCATEHLFRCISKSILVDTNKGERPGRLKFLPADGTVAAVLQHEDDTNKTYESGVRNCENTHTSSNADLFGFVSLAFAQDVRTYEQLLIDLNSPSAFTRRNARQQLADSAVDRIPDLMQEFSSEDSSYRTRLGIAVALAEMMQQGSVDAAAFRSQIQDWQIEFLAGAVAAEDPTLSNVTTQFVKHLADPRMIPQAVLRYSDATTLGQKNLMEAVGASAFLATDEQRSQAVRWLETVDSELKPEAESWIRAIESAGRDVDSVTFQIVVGSYTDQESAKAAAAQINSEMGAEVAKVGVPRPGNPYIPVVYGDRENLDDARVTMDKALSLDSVSDAFLTTYDGYLPN
ncbi:YibE/F family protein [Nitratireductor sp. XY-223]|uniref:YibE/F family protein n=1 Tax=Nitratireductor sp. XY-223 TaxID=2561926 RepID=UPI0010AABBCB|nr:YibE/F family protein [Nitratireductor sp. XY-223]